MIVVVNVVWLCVGKVDVGKVVEYFFRCCCVVCVVLFDLYFEEGVEIVLDWLWWEICEVFIELVVVVVVGFFGDLWCCKLSFI